MASLRESRQTGFTLVELLVTIAILGILFAFLAPAISQARSTAVRASCMTRFQQWSIGMMQYTEDYQGAIPRESFGPDTKLNFWASVSESGAADLWFNALPPYLSEPPVSDYNYPSSRRAEFYGRKRPIHCPAARFARKAELEPWPIFSMAMNSQLYHFGETVYVQELCRAPQTVMFLDNLLPAEPRFDPGQADFSLGQPSASPYRFSTRHRSTGNLIFWDGHVASFQGKEVVETRPGPRRGDIIEPEDKVVWNICPEGTESRP